MTELSPKTIQILKEAGFPTTEEGLTQYIETSARELGLDPAALLSN